MWNVLRVASVRIVATVSAGNVRNEATAMSEGNEANVTSIV